MARQDSNRFSWEAERSEPDEASAVVGAGGAESAGIVKAAPAGHPAGGAAMSAGGDVFGSGDLLQESRVDLIERIEKGIPEREFVPGCEEWLLRGKRYMLFASASAGVGKSIVALVVAVEVVAQGGTVVIIDVENGADEYARRLTDVLEHRGDDVVDACRERLRYYEFPALKLDWTAEEWARSIGGADLVVFDSSRLTLSSVGLSEDANDDYATFVNALVVPLARAESTTLILDNVGHGDGGHPRGGERQGGPERGRLRAERGRVLRPRDRGEGRLAAQAPALLRRPGGVGTGDRWRHLRASEARDQGARGRAWAVPPHAPDGTGIPSHRGRARVLHQLHRGARPGQAQVRLRRGAAAPR